MGVPQNCTSNKEIRLIVVLHLVIGIIPYDFWRPVKAAIISSTALDS